MPRPGRRTSSWPLRPVRKGLYVSFRYLMAGERSGSSSIADRFAETGMIIENRRMGNQKEWIEANPNRLWYRSTPVSIVTGVHGSLSYRFATNWKTRCSEKKGWLSRKKSTSVMKPVHESEPAACETNWRKCSTWPVLPNKLGQSMPGMSESFRGLIEISAGPVERVWRTHET